MAGAPLNPKLYSALHRAFGAVRVSNRGEAFRARRGRDPNTGRPRLDIDQEGEFYIVSCPYCNDSKFRLYVHHQWDQRDAYGRPMRYLAYCFNADCLRDEHNADDFKLRLEFPPGKVRPGKVIPPELRAVTLPGPTTPLHELPPDHPAVRYVRDDRGLDPVRLGRAWGVGYCEHSRHFLASRRLIAPAYDGAKLMVWQARFVGELPWKSKADRAHELPPKWFTCPGAHKSKWLYNLDPASKFKTGVLVESPSTCWAGGPQLCGSFGKSLSATQADLLAARFPAGTSVVLLWDPDAWVKGHARVEAAVAAEALLRPRLGDRLAVVRPPPGVDLGTLERRRFRELVEDLSAGQGVTIDWGLR